MKTSEIIPCSAFMAVVEYMKRSLTFTFPEGKRDGQGRWFPSEREDCGLTATIRAPSRAWPNSYWKAAHSLKHCAALHGVTIDEARRALKALRVHHSDMAISRLTADQIGTLAGGAA